MLNKKKMRKKVDKKKNYCLLFKQITGKPSS